MSVKEVIQINSNFMLPLDELIVSRDLGFGDGRHGNFVFKGTHPYKQGSESAAYEIHSTYFEIPAGYTFKPEKPCSMLAIYSLSDIVINGTIDMKYRGYMANQYADEKPKSFNISGKKCDLALGGATVVSAKGGNGGAVDMVGYPTVSGGTGAIGINKYIGGNHVAGGYSISVIGEGSRFTSSAYAGNTSSYYEDGLERNPTGVVVLIARGKIVIRGKIDCSATPGIAAQSGKTWRYEMTSHGTVESGHSGDGGAGAQAPSGGGAITLIAKQIDRTGGTLDVSGKSYTNTTKGSNATGSSTFEKSSRTVTIYGGTGGEGTPATGFTSQAGNIKEYLYLQ